MSTRLPNSFYVMRHGHSKANEQGIIVSQLATDASGDYGLSGLGRQEALDAAGRCSLGAGTIICSSDFARARQTAEIVRARLAAGPVELAPALRERCFGDWEGTSSGNYATVWAADERDPDHHDHNVEPVTAVLARAVALVGELDARHAGRDILLVSHGDTLQILLAGLAGADPARHRELPHLRTAEIRRLDRS
jgi:probable phosphoglycerate mutase